ncbi:transcriptional regulator [Lichenibacterium dinghuense]|uniref:transcriptional regulator n=1 Tax=Lichenibacterium dinghuense TaxID=2895977 RepID=UPI001F2E2111|nr:WYL domain-containing protein [Lichenibacterium sp. 6Y81]
MEEEKGRTRWGVQRRLEFIDFRLFWNGVINRSDLVTTFGISTAQASADLSQYEDLAPSNMAYDRVSKLYRRTAAFAPLFVGDTMERYLLQLVAVRNEWLDLQHTWFDAPPTMPLEVVTLGRHRIRPSFLLQVLDAVRDGCELEVSYASLTGSREQARVVRPHAIFEWGGRWYMRAWSRGHDDFRDYNINRIFQISGKGPAQVDVSLDYEWTHRINLVIVPNPMLPPERWAAVAAQHGMEDGRLVRSCRLSLSFYLMSEHNLDVETGVLKPEKQQIVLQNRDEVEAARSSMRKMAAQALSRARNVGR